MNRLIKLVVCIGVFLIVTMNMIVTAAHDHYDYVEITKYSSYNGSGNYYLKDDVYISNYFTIGQNQNVLICLNGCNMTFDIGTSKLYVNGSGAKLLLCDCGNGAIINKKSKSYAIGINTGSLYVAGGIIESTNAALYINGDCTVQLSGGIFKSTTAPAIQITATSSLTYADLLADGCGYFDSEGNLLSEEDLTTAAYVRVKTAPEAPDPPPKTYTVTLNANGGSLTTATMTTTSDGTLPTIPTPTRNNYSFAGWYDAPIDGSEITANTVFTSDAEIFAHWTPDSYTVTYAPGIKDEGSEVYANKYHDLPLTLEDAIFTKDNYDQIGWSTTDGGEKEYELKGSYTENAALRLYPVWAPKAYKVTLRLNGGSLEEPLVSYTYGTATQLPTPTAPNGYEYDGWYDAENGGRRVSEISKSDFGDKVYYAYWNPITYAISYHLDSGTNASSNPESYTIESRTIILAEPKRDGFGFDGWYRDAAFSGNEITEIAAGSFGEVNLYAKWSEIIPETYQITYRSGSLYPAADVIDTKTEGVALTLHGAIFTGENHRQIGWTLSENGGIDYGLNELYTEDAVLTLYPVWSPKTYDIAYVTNGGEFFGEALPVQTYTYGNTTHLPTNLAKCGYDFDGWYDDAENGSKITAVDSRASGDKIYYAYWTPTRYSITYNLNDGINSHLNPTEYTVESGDIMLEDPIRDGYIFLGWYDNKNCVGSAVSFIPAGSVGPIAIWASWGEKSPERYTVTYLPGAYSMSNQVSDTKTHDVTLTLAGASFTRSNYHQIGWAMTENGEIAYELNAVYTLNEAITLYPVWAAELYTIKYHLNGGTDAAANPETYTVESDTITLAAPEREGYIFTGWYDNPALRGSAITSIENGSAGELILYAGWILDSHTVTFDPNGGSVSDSNAETNAELKLDSIPTAWREGYRFLGWYTDHNELVTSDMRFTGDTTVTAEWQFIISSVEVLSLRFDYGSSIADMLSSSVCFQTVTARNSAAECITLPIDVWQLDPACLYQDADAIPEAGEVILLCGYFENSDAYCLESEELAASAVIVIDPLRITDQAKLEVDITEIELKIGLYDELFVKQAFLNRIDNRITLDYNGIESRLMIDAEDILLDRNNDQIIVKLNLCGRIGSFDLGDETAELTVGIIEMISQVYTVHVANGTGSGSYKAGSTVTIQANDRYGYTFEKWIISEGRADRINIFARTTTFIMPDEPVRITAVYTKDMSLIFPPFITPPYQPSAPTAPEREAEPSAPDAQAALPFDDVSEQDWFYEDVRYIYERGIMIGVGDEHFSPDATLSRAMLLTMLWRLEGEPKADGGAVFHDVEAGEWYSDAVVWASSHGIVNGYGNGNFKPHQDITREQISAILHRYAVYKVQMDAIGFDQTSPYQHSVWAKQDVLWASVVGIYDNIGTDISDLTHTSTRAEAAAYLTRFCKEILE